MRKKVYRRRAFLRTFKDCDCKVGWTCRVLRIARSTPYVWFKRYPKLREQVREARENWKNREKTEEEIEEEARGRLFRKAQKGNLKAIMKYLKTYAPDRWY